MERYFLHHNDTPKIFSTIRLEYQKTFTASIRDKIRGVPFLSVVSGPYIDAVDRTLTKMVLQPRGAEPESSGRKMEGAQRFYQRKNLQRHAKRFAGLR